MCSKIALFLRNYSSSKSFTYITTPIYYVNANPHIGHLYSSLIADAAQRWQQMRHKDAKIKFSTGTDEHGTKIQQAAKAYKTSLAGYCDGVSLQYRQLADIFNVQYTDFVRTTEERHKGTVQRFWNTLDEKGHIYKSSYKGYYCVSDETFLSDSQLKEVEKNGQKILVSAESGHLVEWSEEPNYIFKLSSFRDDLIYWLSKNEKAIRPAKFQKILLDLIHTEEALTDISVSRPSTRVHWGISVPNDDTQTIYVWLDALVNYLTSVGYGQISDTEFKEYWPADIQVIGKDILKFHGIYWPAFLIAAGLEPPRCIFCHSHWTVDGEKMSKSKGNVVDPVERSQIYSIDGLRYFLLREGVSHSDGNYSDTKLIRIINSELADTLGNLLSRCCGKALNSEQTFPKIQPEAFQKICAMDVTKKLLDNLRALPDVCETHYNDLNFYKVADSVTATLHSANLFFETLKPWELKKSPSTIEELKVVLHLVMETLRISGILLQPLVPNITDKLLNKLSIPNDGRCFENLKTFSWDSEHFIDTPLSSDKAVLFKRILTEESSIKKKVRKC